MDYNKDKVDEVVLALLYLNSYTEKYGTRAWKSFAWEAMDRRHEKDYISNPKSKAKSIVLTEAGLELGRKLFAKHFGA